MRMLTVVLTTISTEVSGISTKIFLAATGAIGTRGTRVARAGREVSSRQWYGGQLGVQKLSVRNSRLTQFIWDCTRIEASQKDNGCSEKFICIVVNRVEGNEWIKEMLPKAPQWTSRGD